MKKIYWIISPLLLTTSGIAGNHIHLGNAFDSSQKITISGIQPKGCQPTTPSITLTANKSPIEYQGEQSSYHGDEPCNLFSGNMQPKPQSVDIGNCTTVQLSSSTANLSQQIGQGQALYIGNLCSPKIGGKATIGDGYIVCPGTQGMETCFYNDNNTMLIQGEPLPTVGEAGPTGTKLE
jgi:acetyltransferase-like isoleucine patch superfamily enzyme